MLILKQQLTKREKWNISVLISELKDVYSEFFLTKQGLRLFIKENLKTLWNTLNKGDKIIFNTDYTGLAIITGYAEKEIKIFNVVSQKEEIKPSRKMIKVLAVDEHTVDQILQYINWCFAKEELYIKVKKTNPIVRVFYNNGWKFEHGRGNEILLKKDKRNFVDYIPYRD